MELQSPAVVSAAPGVVASAAACAAGPAVAAGLPHSTGQQQRQRPVPARSKPPMRSCCAPVGCASLCDVACCGQLRSGGRGRPSAMQLGPWLQRAVAWAASGEAWRGLRMQEASYGSAPSRRCSQGCSCHCSCFCCAQAAHQAALRHTRPNAEARAQTPGSPQAADSRLSR